MDQRGASRIGNTDIGSFENTGGSVITYSGNLTAFSKCVSSVSANQSFTVRGCNLIDNISISAPSEFEISTNASSGFGSSLTLTQSSGSVASSTIFIRLTAASTGSPSGNISFTSNGATTQTVAVSGTVNALPTITGSTTIGSTTSQLTGSGTPNGSAPWISSSTDVATVSNTGLVTPRRNGTSTITYTNSLGCSITAVVTITMPTITTSGTLTAFTKCSVSASASQNFNVSGANMTAAISIAARLGFEYSLTEGGSYTSTLTVGAAGTIASTPVFVRMQSTANTATYAAANIVLSSTSATSVNVSSSGTVNTTATISIQPSTSAATYCSSAIATALSVTAGSTVNLTYQWYSRTTSGNTGGTLIGGANSNTYIPSTSTAVVLFYYCVITNPCGSLSSNSSGAITVNSSVGGSISGSTTVCSGNNSTILTLSGHTGSITRWESSLDNFATAGTTIVNTTTSFTATNLNTTTSYRAVVTNGSCTAANSASATLTVDFNNTWTGTTNNLWNTAANWSCGIVPTANHNVIISSGNPVMDVDFTNPSGKTFTISGIGTLTINAGRTLSIAGTTDFGGKLVTLKSDATGTAAIGTITGTLSNATNVTVERYIASAGRRYRFLSSPVQSKTIANWMTQFYVTGPCTTAPSALGAINDQGWHSNWSNIGAPGAYNASTNPNAVKTTSIRTYDETVSGSLHLGFTNVTTSTALSAGKGFNAFIRGAIGNTGQLDGTVPGQTAVTLSLNGTINQGEVNANPTRTGTSLVDDGWNLLGNPYPSAYDFHAQYNANSAANIANLINTVYVYSAVTAGYVSHNANSNLSSGLTSGIIPSGAGFFIQANAASPVFKFVEAYKTSVNPASLHKTEIKTDEFGIKYFKDSSESDYLVIKMLAGANLNNEMYDIKKFRNDNLNLAAYGQDSIDLAGSCIPPVVDETRINLNVEADEINTYQFEFTNMDNFDANVTVSLLDKYTNKTTNVKANTKYTFDMGAGINQWGKNRFELILNAKTNTGINPVNIVSNAKLSVYPNPATNLLNVNISNANFKNSSVTIYNVSGKQLMNSTMNDSNTALNIESLSNGVYFINVSNENGFNKTVKFVK